MFCNRKAYFLRIALLYLYFLILIFFFWGRIAQSQVMSAVACSRLQADGSDLLLRTTKPSTSPRSTSWYVPNFSAKRKGQRCKWPDDGCAPAYVTILQDLAPTQILPVIVQCVAHSKRDQSTPSLVLYLPFNTLHTCTVVRHEKKASEYALFCLFLFAEETTFVCSSFVSIDASPCSQSFRQPDVELTKLCSYHCKHILACVIIIKNYVNELVQLWFLSVLTFFRDAKI